MQEKEIETNYRLNNSVKKIICQFDTRYKNTDKQIPRSEFPLQNKGEINLENQTHTILPDLSN